MKDKKYTGFSRRYIPDNIRKTLNVEQEINNDQIADFTTKAFSKNMMNIK